MALKQHSSLEERFRQQYLNSKDYLLPFIEERFPIREGMKVLEIGAAEGGVLRPFTERGCWALGVDLHPKRIEVAREMMAEDVQAGKADFIAQNVYEEAFAEKWAGVFDLILLKDTIEHIPEQERFIPYIKKFLKPGGQIFFGFPPWRMPFGGHQQICRGKWLSKIPYYHLLPKGIYRAILKAGKEPDPVVQELLEIKSTGISLARFERICRNSELQVTNRRLYLFNPIYRFKFGIKPREQYRLLAAIPWFRDFVTTAGWYLTEVR
jgi:SAM-dependent methyltransferase